MVRLDDSQLLIIELTSAKKRIKIEIENRIFLKLCITIAITIIVFLTTTFGYWSCESSY